MRLFAILLLAACGSPAPPAPPADARARVAPIAEHQVDIIVGREKFATLSEDELAAGTRLDLLVPAHPYATWTSVELRGPGRSPVLLMQPARGYPGAVPRVRSSADTRTAVFELASASGPVERVDDIDEIRIDLALREPDSLEALAAGCTRPERGAERPPTPPRHWRGSALQFSTRTRGTYELELDLSPGPAGSHAGVLRARGYSDPLSLSFTCTSDLYRAPDQYGQRIYAKRVRPGSPCIDGILAFVCDGAKLAVKGYYLSGEYVMSGTLEPRL